VTRRAFGVDLSNSTFGRNNGNAGKNQSVVQKHKNVVPSSSSNLRRSENESKQPVAVSRRQQLTRTDSIKIDTKNASVMHTMSYQRTGPVDDIDDTDKNDLLAVTDYVQDMYEWFRERELVTAVQSNFMEKQPHINEKMRSILIDWLADVHLKFKLVPETLFLTVNLIDRYLERKVTSRNNLQLVGVSALLIASKYEEIYFPEMRDLVYVCDRAYTKEHIIAMEQEILETLEYKITVPSAHAFLVRYLKAAHADKKIVQISSYILDSTLLSYGLRKYLPSQLAAAAVFIARTCVGRHSWSPTLLKYAEYSGEEIVPVARAVLLEKERTTKDWPAINEKHASRRFGGVSKTVMPTDI